MVLALAVALALSVLALLTSLHYVDGTRNRPIIEPKSAQTFLYTFAVPIFVQAYLC